LSNAAGESIKTSKKGDLILLDDHINLQGGSPLSGLNSFEYGGIFPDMRLMTRAKYVLTEASKMELSLKRSVCLLWATIRN
jgi:purine-nucleoside phosphorylase